jgi:glycosyltransferase 2 family protein
MTYRIRTVLNFIFGIVLSGILLYVAFRGTDFQALRVTLKNVNYWWILTSIPLLLFCHYIRAWRWQLLLVPVKDKVGRGNAFSSLLIGYMVNNILPRAGELFRPYVLGKMEQISKASSLGSVVLERLLDLFSLLLGIMIVFYMYRSTLVHYFPWWNSASLILIGLCFIFLIVLGIMLYKRELILKLLNFILYPLSDNYKQRGGEILNSFIDGMLIIRQRQNIGAIVLLSVVMWIGYIFMAYLPLLAFDISGTSINLLTGFVLTIVTSVSVLVPTPGATGSFHTMTVESLTRLYGLKREIALGYATLIHAAGYFSVIAIGLYYLTRYNIKVRDVLDEADSQAVRADLQTHPDAPESSVEKKS